MMTQAFLIIVSYIAGITIFGYIINIFMSIKDRNDRATDTIEED
jgi:uncharacterized alpha/beta hydrolase family protein